jgi:glycosyltransferase involved in cell wall biosynthesis
VRERHPDFRFRVIGPNPPKAVTDTKPEGVEVTGWVEDPREHLRAATMAAVPLRAGSGARLKILEAMALGRPVVSTTIGAEGIELTPGVEFECGDDPPAFAQAICRLIEDERRRVSIGLASRAVFEQSYSAEGAVTALLEFYDEVGLTPKPRLTGSDR